MSTGDRDFNVVRGKFQDWQAREAKKEAESARRFKEWGAQAMAEMLVEDIQALDPATREVVKNLVIELQALLCWLSEGDKPVA